MLVAAIILASHDDFEGIGYWGDDWVHGVDGVGWIEGVDWCDGGGGVDSSRRTGCCRWRAFSSLREQRCISAVPLVTLSLLVAQANGRVTCKTHHRPNTWSTAMATTGH